MQFQLAESYLIISRTRRNPKAIQDNHTRSLEGNNRNQYVEEIKGFVEVLEEIWNRWDMAREELNKKKSNASFIKLATVLAIVIALVTLIFTILTYCKYSASSEIQNDRRVHSTQQVPLSRFVLPETEPDQNANTAE